MKATIYLRLFTVLITAFLFISTAAAQESRSADVPSTETERPVMKKLHDNRADLLHRLGLTEEQMQQLRTVHAERRPLMNEAQKRLRETTRALNEAIYSDQLDESAIQGRLNDRQIAQAEVEKLRFMTELAVRRILTQEQLVHFRQLRERFEKVRQVMDKHRQFKETRQKPRKDFNKPHTPDPRPLRTQDQQIKEQ